MCRPLFVCFHFYGLSGVPNACLKHLLKLPVNHTSLSIKDIRRQYQNYTELLISELLSLTTSITQTILEQETIKISVSEVNTCLRAHSVNTKKSTATFSRSHIQQRHLGSAMLTRPFRHSVTALRNAKLYIQIFFSRKAIYVDTSEHCLEITAFLCCMSWIAYFLY